MSQIDTIKERTTINSYGIIAFCKINNTIKYLMIQRNNTFGYIDVIKGKYDEKNLIVLKNLINNMTKQERANILTQSFETLWNNMWFKKFSFMKDIKDKYIKNSDLIKNIINNCKYEWIEPEWEFPKGRKIHGESDIKCAKREFVEETGIELDKIKLIENVIAYDEYNIGTNFKPYYFKLYLAYIDNHNVDISHYQSSEVNTVKWLTYEECLQCIRCYHYDKMFNLKKINKLLNTFILI